MNTPSPTYLVLLGAPASGKGTQAALLKEHLQLPHIASGDLFREHLNRKTELGRKARSFIDQGKLVPDDITIAMVMQRLEKPDTRRGAILDGFPRTIAQAQALDQALGSNGHRVSIVPFINVPDDVIIERVSGRLLCRRCGESYHLIFNPPKIAGVCDKCGGELYQRDDDKPETVRTRLAVFRDQTNPLIEYYRSQSVLVEVDGDQPIDDVHTALRTAIESHLD